MPTTVHDIINTVWPLLPQLTTGLRFCTALIGLGLAVAAAARRVRQHRRPTRSS